MGTYLREDIPIFAINLDTNTLADLLIEDLNDNDVFDSGDELIINERMMRGPRMFRHRVRLLAKDPSNSIPPTTGNALQIINKRPFATGDFFQFTLRPSVIDADAARNELDRIAVVPNPYVAAAEWERRSQIVGRGERLVQFIHLPHECTIRIYNVRGELVKTIEHSSFGSDGVAWWDLKTDNNQDVAFGVYIFHVEAPGIGEHIGKLALIK